MFRALGFNAVAAMPLTLIPQTLKTVHLTLLVVYIYIEPSNSLAQNPRKKQLKLSESTTLQEPQRVEKLSLQPISKRPRIPTCGQHDDIGLGVLRPQARAGEFEGGSLKNSGRMKESYGWLSKLGSLFGYPTYY